jgi:DNA-directed RNA polymerase subunit RPC12/RpoP
MECPKCKSEVNVLFDDGIKCPECNELIVVDYCSCPSCHYTFRAIEGHFIDELELDRERVDEAMGCILELMGEDSSMVDLLNPCVRCGSPKTTHNEDYTEFKCLECDFEWGISNE